MNEMMRAAVLEQFGQPLHVKKVPRPEPGPGEALVKICASGLCMTDVHIAEGMIASVKLPYIPGHEMAGIVERLGDGTEGPAVGTHVICGIDIVCGHCRLCYGGRENLCRERVRIGFERNGSHAEYAVVPVRNLFPIAEKVPMEQACVIPDAVACMLHAITDIGQTVPGENALIYGVGGLGFQGIQILRHIGTSIYAASRTEAKLEEARKLGADATINTRQQDLVSEIRRLTNNEMMDVIFDLVGNQESTELLLNCLRPGGRIVAVAYAVPQFSGNYQELVIKEKQVLGIRGSTRQNMLDSIRMVEDGIIVPTITGSFSLEEINDALKILKENRGMGRNVIVL